MSLYDKASIALIPSGTKASKLYSVLPANGNGDFTHTRGSTATRLNKDGLIESVATNVPRLDYPLIDGAVQDCPALLLEPSRTNLSEYSESFDNWGSGGSYVTANQAISPDGSLTADKLTKSGSFVQISEAATISSGVNYVFSVFVKADTGTHITLRQASGSNDVRRFFNLEDLTIGNSGGNNTGLVSEKIEKFPNNWFRVSTVCTSNGTSLAINIYAGQAGNTTFDGNIFLWGAQVEEGDFETSYTPNLSTGSTTRSADVCNGSGTSAEFNVTEGVLFAQIKGLVDVDTGNRYISLTDGTVANSVMIQYRNTGELRLYNGGTSTSNMIFRDASADLTQNKKVAIKYGSSTSDYIVFINGFKKTVESGFSASALTALDEIKFTYVSSGNTWYGNAKQLITFKKALTDSELETLTSYDSFDDMATGQLYTIE